MNYKDLPKREQQAAALELISIAYAYYGTNAEAEDLAISAGILAEDLSCIPDLQVEELSNLFTSSRKKQGDIYKCYPALIYKMIKAEKSSINQVKQYAQIIEPAEVNDKLERERAKDFADSVAIPFLTLLSECREKEAAKKYPFIPASVIYDFLLKHNAADLCLEDEDYNEAIHELEKAAEQAGYFEAKELKDLITQIAIPKGSTELSFRAKAYAVKRLALDEQRFKAAIYNLKNI